MRIVIAEDSVLLLDGLTRLLVAEGHTVTGYRTADELVARLDESLGFASDVSHAAVHGLCRTCRESP